MKKYFLSSLVLCGLPLLPGCGGASAPPPPPHPLTISSAAPPSGTTGSPYAGNGFLLTASGGVAPYNWSWAPAAGSSLPPGLTLLSNGMILGTPTIPKTYDVVITVSDSQSPAARNNSPYAIKVAAGVLVITSGAPPSGIVGANYASGGFPLTASGGAAPYTSSWAAASGSSLPAGLTLANGTISGIPTAAGSYNVVVTITDSQTSAAQISSNYTITIASQTQLQITSGNPPPGTAGLVYPLNGNGMHGAPLAASGGIAPYEFSWVPASGSSIPPGLSIVFGRRGTNCLITGWQVCGIPTASGTYKVVVSLSDSASPQNQLRANYSITIRPPRINVVPLPIGAINIAYSFTFTAVAGFPPYTWSETGPLPPGLTLATDGTLSGTPTATGSFSITVTVVDSKSESSAPVDFIVEIAAHGFKSTGSMASPRAHHAATLLLDGRVLVTGGNDLQGQTRSAELYDPSKSSFSPTGSMITGREGHTSTLLSTGRVLVAGGFGSNGPVRSAELYDPSAGTFSATGSMQIERSVFTATLLEDGRVLVAGGRDVNGNVSSRAEIFDPLSGVFTPTGNMATPRASHTATLLSNGKVLVAGGCTQSCGNADGLNTAELYDPGTGTFTATGDMTTARSSHTATALKNNIFLAGGLDTTGSPLASTEIYDVATGTFSASATLPEPSHDHMATLLSDGTVLVTGGVPGGNISPYGAAEVFDPIGDTFTLTGTMSSVRFLHTATAFKDGTVLVVGGDNGPTIVNTAEIYQ